MRREIQVLGPVRVRCQGRDVPVRGPKQRRLLCLLVRDRGHTVGTSRLVDALWGESASPRAGHALQAQMCRLRKALAPLGDEVVVTDDAGYRLVLDGDEVDAERFDRLLARGRGCDADGDLAGAARALGEALALWRGLPFGEEGSAPALAAETARLTAARDVAEDLAVEVALARGRHQEVLPDLEHRVAQHPLREPAWRQLMLARYRAGRQAEALAAYRDLRRMLHDELGIEPSLETQRLHRAILVQDAGLTVQRWRSSGAWSAGTASGVTSARPVRSSGR